MSKSSSFDLLDERIQKWIWKQGWTSLKEIQELAIPIILRRTEDVVISAETAGGKTEAAFLPILTYLLQNGCQYGYQVLYISPLKALINDQCRRLSDMTTDMEIAVTPWHGDIGDSIKKKSLKNPNGILIITPESLESFLINRSSFVNGAFDSLKYIVIDELHSFIGSERGKQIQSLLSRIEHIIHKRIPKIAMSATFSDYSAVKSFLRNDTDFPCTILPQGKNNHETMLLIKEYLPTDSNSVQSDIALEIFTKLRGANNLVFTNSRDDTECYSLALSELCAKHRVPNEFRPHHGSLSKEERESLEHDLNSGNYPTTAICTSTLELGIDIGQVKSIAQIGVAKSVSSLRQRLGRSGRRGEPSILRVFSIEESDGLSLDLRTNLVQNVAVVELLIGHQYEKGKTNSYHFSTLIQQVLSLLAEFGSFYPKQAWTLLCKEGAFQNVTPQMFLSLLSELGKRKAISQLGNGQIVIDKEGEFILSKRDFYTAFVTVPEFIVIDNLDGKKIGYVGELLEKGQTIILSGRRWIVDNVDKRSKVIYANKIHSGGGTHFSRKSGPNVDEIIASKMEEIYSSEQTFPYLDRNTFSDTELVNARQFYSNHKIGQNKLQSIGECNILFSWNGDKINETISLITMKYLQKQAQYDYFYVKNISAEDIHNIIQNEKPDAIELAQLLSRPFKVFQKYDYLLPDELLNLEYAATYLDVEGAWAYLNKIYYEMNE